MAVQQKSLSFGTLSGSASTIIYTVPQEKNTRAFLVLTNTVSTVANPEVSINDGTQRVLVAGKIASGSGKAWRVLEVSDLRLDAGDEIILRLISGGPINYFVSGIEYDVEAD